jgi:hypothetical protein
MAPPDQDHSGSPLSPLKGRTVMRVKEEFTEAQRRFGLLSFYDKF